MLYRHLRVNQIFGANTEIGKTVLSTGLVRANLALDAPLVSYLKPVGTSDASVPADDAHVAKFASGVGVGVNKGTLSTACLFKFDQPVSPHLAVERNTNTSETIPTDAQFVQAIRQFGANVARLAPSDAQSALYIETAGGVHSPTLSGSSQLDAYRPLRLPTILIASSELGGISTTISSYESLLLRGYDVDGIICFKEDYYENWKYLKRHFEKQNSNIKFATVSPPPVKLQDAAADAFQMHAYYKRISEQEDALPELVRALHQAHLDRLDYLDHAPQRALDTYWWPFLQHSHIKGPEDVVNIDSSFGDHFNVYANTASESAASTASTAKDLLVPTFDGSASWWTQCFGHTNPDLTLAAAHASGRYGHVLFPAGTYEPALALSENLLQSIGKGWASRVFFTDDGSTGMEVALKMALRAYAKRHEVTGNDRYKMGVLGIKGSYHGDTIGAMDACEASVYSKSVEWYRGRGFWFDPPHVQIRAGHPVVEIAGSQWGDMQQSVMFDDVSDIYDVDARMSSQLARVYREHILDTLTRLTAQGDVFGALVLEPVLMGAAGMIFVDPLFQRMLVETVRSAKGAQALNLVSTEPTSGTGWENIPVVFDEVFTGLCRIGPLTPTAYLGCHPDIACYAKILTGGLVPMSVTLASQPIFEAFLAESKTDALLHGHSYTAYPVGCAVANKSLEKLQAMTWPEAKRDWNADGKHGKNKNWSLWSREVVHQLSELPSVKGTMTLGTVLVVQLQAEADDTGYQSSLALNLLRKLQARLFEQDQISIHCRTLGDVLYIMSSLNTPLDTLRLLERHLVATLAKSTG